MTDPLAINPEPPRGVNFRRMLPTLVFDVAMPIITFNVLARSGVSALWALVAGGIFPASNNLRVWARSRRFEPLGIIVMAFLALGAAVSQISGSVFFALIQGSILTATFGFICLGSLLAERPLMFYVTRHFVAGDDPVQAEWWNGLWQYPNFRDAQGLVTAVWGITYLGEALLRVSLTLALSPAKVVVISPVMAFGAMIVLILWTQRYLFGRPERRARERQLSQAG